MRPRPKGRGNSVRRIGLWPPHLGCAFRAVLWFETPAPGQQRRCECNRWIQRRIHPSSDPSGLIITGPLEGLLVKEHATSSLRHHTGRAGVKFRNLPTVSRCER